MSFIHICMNDEPQGYELCLKMVIPV